MQYQCLSLAIESIVSPCVAERAKDGCDNTVVLVTVTKIEMQIVYKIILCISLLREDMNVRSTGVLVVKIAEDSISVCNHLHYGILAGMQNHFVACYSPEYIHSCVAG